jgi:Heavy-metal resistance
MSTATVVGSLGFAACAAIVVAGVLATPALAQRGGRGSAPMAEFQRTRLEILASSFSLNKDQKKAVKTILDSAHTRASSARDGLARTRAAIAAAIQANKEPAEIDRAIGEYADQAAAMTAVEMTALAEIIQTLDPAQRANTAALRSAFFLMRGIFLDKKRWDDIPDSRSY